MNIEMNHYSAERLSAAMGTSKTFLSNMYQLRVPVTCDLGFQYWNSEGLYMALRTNILDERSWISKQSKKSGFAAKEARKMFALDQDQNNRAGYMLNAVRQKFSNNPELASKLILVDKEIIEINTWKDNFFGVDLSSGNGCNVLGKVLMQVREELKLLNP